MIMATVLIAIPIALSGSFVQLAAISMVSRFAQYLPTCLAVMVLRRRTDLPQGFKVPFGPVIPIIATVICVWLLSKATQPQLLWGLGALVIGVPLFFLMLVLNRKHGPTDPASLPHLPEVQP
jgi:amino acid transporter